MYLFLENIADFFKELHTLRAFFQFYILVTPEINHSVRCLDS